MKAIAWLLALLPALAGAAEPVRLDLSLKSPLAVEAPVVDRTVLPANETLPPTLAVPGAPFSSEIPALPPSAAQLNVGSPESLGALERAEAPTELPRPLSAPDAIVRDAAGPQALSSLESLGAAADPAQPRPDLASRFFDRRTAPVTAAFEGDGSRPGDQGPKRPRGVSSISVDTVHDAADILRLIPNGVNSDELKRKLVENVDTMAPYTIYTYRDVRSGSFTGIDLSRNPQLVELLPEQQSHEVRLIKKIQAWNQDLQVLVRETGKTPDLVVGGVVTELKSLIGDKVDFTYLLNKANNQVHEHAQRHGLGNGAVVIDLTAQTRVPVKTVSDEIELWRRMPAGYEIPGFYTGPRHKKQAIALDKIYVFAGADLKMFVRVRDGSFRLGEPARIPFALAGGIKGHKKHQLFLKSGPPRAPPSDTALGKAFDRLFLIKEIREMVAKRRYKRAYDLWDDYSRQERLDVVFVTKRQLRDVMPLVMKGRRNRGGETNRGYRG